MTRTNDASLSPGRRFVVSPPPRKTRVDTIGLGTLLGLPPGMMTEPTLGARWVNRGPWGLAVAWVVAAGVALGAQSAAAEPAGDPSTSAETVEGTLVPVDMKRRDARTSGRLGFDLRLGTSHGMLQAATVGLDVIYVPWAPLHLVAGADSNGATISGHVEAQLNLLTLFRRSPWTPFVRAGYGQMWFTNLADRILEASAGDVRSSLGEVGTDLRFSGMHLHLLRVGGGVDLLSRGGFHFQAFAGRSFMVGESQGRDAREGIELTYYESWNLTLAVGWIFR